MTKRYPHKGTQKQQQQHNPPYSSFRSNSLSRLTSRKQGEQCIFYYFWFHTYFVENGYVAYEKNEVDGNRKYKKNPFKKKWSSVKTELFFDVALPTLETL